MSVAELLLELAFFFQQIPFERRRGFLERLCVRFLFGHRVAVFVHRRRTMHGSVIYWATPLVGLFLGRIDSVVRLAKDDWVDRWDLTETRFLAVPIQVVPGHSPGFASDLRTGHCYRGRFASELEFHPDFYSG